MCKLLFSKIEQKPQFLLCLLPERKNSPLYGLPVPCNLFIFSTDFSNLLIHPVLFCKVTGKGRIWLSMELLHSALLQQKSMVDTWQMCFSKSMQRFSLLLDYGCDILIQSFLPLHTYELIFWHFTSLSWQLGGLNSKLSIEHSPSNPLESKIPTLILGMSVFNGSPGKSGVPSIAAVNHFF